MPAFSFHFLTGFLVQAGFELSVQLRMAMILILFPPQHCDIRNTPDYLLIQGWSLRPGLPSC